MSNLKKRRRSFTEEYRREAAGLVIDTGRSIAAVAKELNLGEPTGALDESEREELKRLRKEVFELREDNRFLGKRPPSSRRSNIGRTVRTDARVED